MAQAVYEMEVIVHAVPSQKFGCTVNPFSEEQISALTLVTNASGNSPQKNHQGRAKGSGEDDGEIYRLVPDESCYPQFT